MRIALVATPFTDHNLQLASQIGVTDIVIRYPGCHIEDIEPLCQQVIRHGMKISVVEGYLPIEKVVLGQDGYRAWLRRAHPTRAQHGGPRRGRSVLQLDGPDGLDAHLVRHAGTRRRAVQRI